MKKILGGLAIAACFLSACSGKMSATVGNSDSTAIKLAHNKQAAINVALAYNKGDADAAYKDCTPDFTEYANGESKPMKGLDSLKLNLKAFFKAFPDFKGENLHALAEGDSVIVTGDWSGTFKNDYMTIKPTQKMFKAPEADIFAFNKEGKIISHRTIQSEVTYFYQLGIPMPPKK